MGLVILLIVLAVVFGGVGLLAEGLRWVLIIALVLFVASFFSYRAATADRPCIHPRLRPPSASESTTVTDLSAANPLGEPAPSPKRRHPGPWSCSMSVRTRRRPSSRARSSCHGTWWCA